ncbi:hypothetical protein ACFVTF_26925 [Kitasatospora sp. NPDC057940]|uniref:hypothetical protein n=1 Tax=Kitasatospora sp. NPDC057940 TaxID=3346285 RepID=UPI0036D78FED
MAAAVLAAGAGLFYNGYGPMALKDRGANQLGSLEAKGQLDETLRTAMDAIAPPVTYFGGGYVVDRDPEHADGEPSLLSQVMLSARFRTKVAPAKLPVLLDRLTQLWGERCWRQDDTIGSEAKRYVELNCPGRGTAGFNLLAVNTPSDLYFDVSISARVTPVRYQPEKDYGASPVGPRLTGHEGAPDVDDPYWSH